MEEKFWYFQSHRKNTRLNKNGCKSQSFLGITLVNVWGDKFFHVIFLNFDLFYLLSSFRLFLKSKTFLRIQIRNRNPCRKSATRAYNNNNNNNNNSDIIYFWLFDRGIQILLFHFLFCLYFAFFGKYMLTLLEIELFFLQENKTLKHSVILIVLNVLVLCSPSPRKLGNLITKFAIIYKKLLKTVISRFVIG